ncbi:MAG: hypothetical protein AB8B91_07045 [Rubripirellula sp.]
MDHSESPQPAVREAAVAPADTARSSVFWLALFVCAVMLAIFATRSSAQGYASIPMHKALQAEAAVKSLEANSKKFLLSGVGSKNSVVGYYEYYVPAKMTDPTDGVKHISQLSKDTVAFLSRVQRGNRPAVARALLESVYKGMKKVAEGNHHPAARINAVLILSRLDVQQADNASRTPPVPLSAVLPILVKLYDDENNVDGVRAAALQGIHRHVMYSFPRMAGDKKAAIQTAMTSLLEAEPPKDRDAAAHAYLQRYAVDILDILRPAADTALGSKLVGISQDPKNHSLIALYSASKLGPMGSALKDKIDKPEDLLNSWAMRAYQAFLGESKRLAALERPAPSTKQPRKAIEYLEKPDPKATAPRRTPGMEMDMDMDMEMDMGMDDRTDETGMGMEMMAMDEMMGMGGGMGMMTPTAKPQPPQVTASRRRLNFVLQQLHLGVTGVAQQGMPTKNVGGVLASVGEAKEPVESWVTKMDEVLTVINDVNHDDLKKYQDALDEQVEVLRVYLGVEEEAAHGVPAGMAPSEPTEMVGNEGAAPSEPTDIVDELAPIAVDELAAP